jgi:carboxymethylenebutenolidase
MVGDDHAARLAAAWDQHVTAEFETRDAVASVATMTDDTVLIHVPTGTGGRGKAAVERFYAEHFIPAWPDDVSVEPISRSVGTDTLVDEMLITCTHHRVMDFWLPGLAASGRRIELPTVAVVGFRGEQISFERIYWDQASLLVQVGALDRGAAPMLGAEQAGFLTDPAAPLNELLP